MGFWSKAILTKKLHKKSTRTTVATKTTTTTKTENQHKNQRQCPLLQQEQQQKLNQQQGKKLEGNCIIQQHHHHQQQKQPGSTEHQNQHPPTLFQSKVRPRKTKPCSEEDHQKSKHKVQLRSHIPSKNLSKSTSTCHCCKKQQQQQQEHQLQWHQQQHKLHHHHQQQKIQKQSCSLPNEGESYFQIRKKPECKAFRKVEKTIEMLPWICIPFLLSMTCCASSFFTTVTAQSVTSPSLVSPATTVLSTTTKAAAAIAPLTAYATLAATMASVSGAANAVYANDVTNYDTKPLELNANAAETNNGDERSIHSEPGEELMYAYYKRAQRHQQQQQRHQHQHAGANSPINPTETLQEFNFDEIVPTLGMTSDLSNTKKIAPSRTQKRSDKSTLNTPKSATATSTSTPTTAATETPTAAPTLSHPSSASSSSSSTGSTTASPDDEKCEPKVLDEVPTEPYYDFSDVAEDAARQFTEFLANKFPSGPPHPKHNISLELRQEITRRAYGIASNALNEDDNLLAFAIAAPNVHTVVLKFRSNVTVPPEQAQNKSFLGSYWRELIYALNSTEGSQEWGAPFRDCNLLKKRWLWPFRVSYAEYKFKIVTAAFIAADEDVCNDGLEDVFGRRHGCDRNTTFCLLIENKPLPPRDVYTCICKESFYLPNSTLQGFAGDVVEMSEGFDNYSCIPCPGGCTHCDQNGECLLLGEPTEVVSMESLMKVSVGAVLGGCILCCFVLSVIVFRQRKGKAIAIGMWIVLETLLLGISLLYASVAVHFFPASTERCLIEPWLRELGFIVFYGAIILKLYRHLVDFRTRKAHRWVLRDVDLLKYLGTMVFAVLCYLAGFTASSIDLLKSAQLESLREISTNTCLPLKWDYVTQISEMLVLLFGLHLSFASRNANTQFRERQFLVASLVLEFLVSSTFYILRFIYLEEMSPSTIFLALFVRSQLTNTISIGLIFVPKLWYQYKQVRSLAYDLSIRLPVDAFKGSQDAGQRLGAGYAGLCLGDPDIGELTISEMSPEDIRAELKRLYTQLEVLKNQTLRQDNPHISKRRGGRKAGHRRFSLQALSAKHRSNKHHQDIEITEAEPSRTPEDSVCSVEGPTDVEISGISHSMLSHSVLPHSVVSHSK